MLAAQPQRYRVVLDDLCKMFIEQRNNQLLLHVKVVPNSSRTQLAGTLGNALKIKVAQPPEDGKANKALIAFLAEILRIPKNNIALVSGQTRPQKTLQLVGITQDVAERLLHA